MEDTENMTINSQNDTKLRTNKIGLEIDKKQNSEQTNNANKNDENNDSNNRNTLRNKLEALIKLQEDVLEIDNEGQLKEV